MPRLPLPPLPKIPQPKPERPGNANGKLSPTETAAEAGISVVDWIDERTSLSGGLRWMLIRKVPQGIKWFYTHGSATRFAFFSQPVTAVFLAMSYRPDATGGAYESIRYITGQ